SVTLEESNLLWLKGRAAVRKKRSLSDALDEIVTAARRGGSGADAVRSVVDTIDIAPDDPGLERADDAIQAMFDASLMRPIVVREEAPRYAARSARKPASRKRRG